MRKNMGLYRGKRQDNRKWVEGSLFFMFGKTYICPEAIAMYYFDGALCLGGFVEVDPETVGQFTGLKDKNGVKIFEGNIVRATDLQDADLVGMVVWRYDAWCVSGANGAYSLHMANFLHKLVVIGNTHDNPELLEVSK